MIVTREKSVNQKLVKDNEEPGVVKYRFRAN